MKWKSVTPESKRRESPKFEKSRFRDHAHYGNCDYRGGYHRNREYHEYQSGHYENRNDHYEQYTNSAYPSYTSSYTSSYHQQQQPNSVEIRLMEMERRERDLQRELEFYRNQPVVKEQPEDDEIDEDELYFHGGGTRKQPVIIDNEIHNDQFVDNDQYNDQFVEEYDPADFESDPSSSSSWSSDEDDSIKSKKHHRPNKKLKTTHNNTVTTTTTTISSASRPKAYAPKLVDLDAHSYMKLPPNPVPSTWANLIHNPLKPKSKEECKEIVTGSVRSGDWIENVSGVQGILMRPPFDDDEFTVKKWSKFMQLLLPKVMPAGYLFIWVEREELAQVLRACEKYLAFKYVENLCWIRRDLGNKIMKEVPQKSGLFYKSKMTLLILRRDPNNVCKLRHQRNPDCILDFVGPGRMPDGRVYDVIETLLDGSKATGPHLMHLWAGNSPTDRLVYQSRKHWIRVFEGAVNNNNIAGSDTIEDETYIAETDTLVANKDNQIISPIETDITESDIVNAGTVDTAGNEIIDTVDTEIIDTVDIKTTKTTEIGADTLQTTNTIVSDITVPTSTKKWTIDPATTVTDSSSTYDVNSSTFDEDFCNFIICEPI